MRFWGWIVLLYALMWGGIAVILQGGTAGSACRDTGAAIRTFASGAETFPGFWDGVRGIGSAIEDACSHR